MAVGRPVVPGIAVLVTPVIASIGFAGIEISQCNSSHITYLKMGLINRIQSIDVDEDL